MKLLHLVNKLDALSQLIAMRATGTPEEFARKLQISKSTLFRLLNELKELGVDIVYNSTCRCYEFKSGKRFYIGILSEKLDKEDMNDTKGGKNFFTVSFFETGEF